MLVQLRFQPSPSIEAPPVDAFQLLLECHERIRGFVALATRLAVQQDVPAAQRAEAAARVKRYFTVALPLHVEDEDASLTPRLHRVRMSPEGRRALSEMALQHLAIDVLLAMLVPAWEALSRNPELHAELAGRLVEDTALLARHLDEHLRLEEDVIFPEARALMAPGDVRELTEELRARRNPPPH